LKIGKEGVAEPLDMGAEFFVPTRTKRFLVHAHRSKPHAHEIDRYPSNVRVRLIDLAMDWTLALGPTKQADPARNLTS
jgi:hypothetical protein